MESMDAQMDMGKYYDLDDQGKPVALGDSVQPFRMEDMKTCAMCRGHLRDISRYGRLVRQALLDESTKRFILYLNREYLPLADEMASSTQRLRDTGCPPMSPWPTTVCITGTPSAQVQLMKTVLGKSFKTRWGPMLKLRERIQVYRHRVSPDEQPFIRVLNVVENARRRQQMANNFEFGGDSLPTKGTLLAMALTIRLDIALLIDFLRLRNNAPNAGGIKVVLDLQEMRAECKFVIDTARKSNRPPLEAEGYIHLAELHALERCYCPDVHTSLQHVNDGRTAAEQARHIVTRFPNQTRGLMSEIDNAENMLLSTFYMVVTNRERLEVVQAMASEFTGTGHWYYCRNGHPFTIGDCGGAMERSFCPECGAPVGGENHQVVEGVTSADDLERSASQFNW